MQRVKDETGNPLFQQVTQNSEAVMTGGFEPCFYVFGVILERGNEGKEFFEALAGIGNGKRFGEQFPVLREKAAVVLVLGDIDTEIDHGEFSLVGIDTV